MDLACLTLSTIALSRRPACLEVGARDATIQNADRLWRMRQWRRDDDRAIRGIWSPLERPTPNTVWLATRPEAVGPKPVRTFRSAILVRRSGRSLRSTTCPGSTGRGHLMFCLQTEPQVLGPSKRRTAISTGTSPSVSFLMRFKSNESTVAFGTKRSPPWDSLVCSTNALGKAVNRARDWARLQLIGFPRSGCASCP
jgi:hypothetical protein